METEEQIAQAPVQSIQDLLIYAANRCCSARWTRSSIRGGPKDQTAIYQEVVTDKKTKPYTFAQKAFSKDELDYWAQFGVTIEILKAYKVISLKKYDSETADATPFSLCSYGSEPMFGYLGKRYIKLYRPFSKIRFLYGGDLGDKYCFGLEQLPTKGDTLFITGGEKDVMS